MKIVIASNGKKTIKMSKSEWEQIGKTAGWMKIAQTDPGMTQFNPKKLDSNNIQIGDIYREVMSLWKQNPHPSHEFSEPFINFVKENKQEFTHDGLPIEQTYKLYFNPPKKYPINDKEMANEESGILISKGLTKNIKNKLSGLFRDEEVKIY